MGPRNISVAAIMTVALAAGIFVALRMQAPAELRAAFVLPAATPLPEFSLLDQSGQPVSRDVFRGHWNLVFFGFTHCPDICPVTLQILAKARQALAREGQQPLPRIVLVSVDPERDTPALLQKYVDYFGDGNLGITGNIAELEKLTSALGIYFKKQPGNAGDYAVDHSAAVLVIDPDGEFHALFSGPHSIDNFVHDMPLLMAAD